MEMEWYMTFLEPNDVDTDEVIELADHVNRLHSAMPFTEAERHWLSIPTNILSSLATTPATCENKN